MREYLGNIEYENFKYEIINKEEKDKKIVEILNRIFGDIAQDIYIIEHLDEKKKVNDLLEIYFKKHEYFLDNIRNIEHENTIQKNKYNKKIKEEEEKNKKLNEENDKNKKEANKFNKLINDMTKKIEINESEIGENVKKIKENENKIEGNKKKIEENKKINKVYTELEKENNKLEKENEELKEKNEKLEEENKKLNNNLDNIKQKYEELNKQHDIYFTVQIGGSNANFIDINNHQYSLNIDNTYFDGNNDFKNNVFYVFKKYFTYKYKKKFNAMEEPNIDKSKDKIKNIKYVDKLIIFSIYMYLNDVDVKSFNKYISDDKININIDETYYDDIIIKECNKIIKNIELIKDNNINIIFNYIYHEYKQLDMKYIMYSGKIHNLLMDIFYKYYDRINNNKSINFNIKYDNNVFEIYKYYNLIYYYNNNDNIIIDYENNIIYLLVDYVDNYEINNYFCELYEFFISNNFYINDMEYMLHININTCEIIDIDDIINKKDKFVKMKKYGNYEIYVYYGSIIFKNIDNKKCLICGGGADLYAEIPYILSYPNAIQHENKMKGVFLFGDFIKVVKKFHDYFSNLSFIQHILRKKNVNEIKCPNNSDPLATQKNIRNDGKQECIRPIKQGSLQCNNKNLSHLSSHNNFGECMSDNLGDNLLQLKNNLYNTNENMEYINKLANEYTKLGLSKNQIIKLRDSYKLPTMSKFNDNLINDPELSPYYNALSAIHKTPVDIILSNQSLYKIYKNSYPNDIDNLKRFFI